MAATSRELSARQFPQFLPSPSCPCSHNRPPAYGLSDAPDVHGPARAADVSDARHAKFVSRCLADTNRRSEWCRYRGCDGPSWCLSLTGSILTERAHGPASFLLRGASRPRYRVRCQPEPIRPFACVRTTRVSCTHVVDVIPVPLKIDSTSRPCMGSPSMGVRRHVDQPSPCML